MNRLWALFVVVLVLSFAVLGWIGTRIHEEMPPIPERVITTSGKALIEQGEISAGQNVWQTLGGMQVGSIWGHGSYVAPDWTADWLHREAIFILNRWAEDDFKAQFDALTPEQQAQLQGRLTESLRKNTYDADSRTLTVDPLRGAAFEANLAHYTDVFTNGKTEYAMRCHGSRSPAETVGVLFLDRLGGDHQSARRRHLLYTKLAARAPRGQPPDRRNRRLDRRQHHHAFGGHFRHGVVVCRAAI
jgi:nitric oxide reductase subunit B